MNNKELNAIRNRRQKINPENELEKAREAITKNIISPPYLERYHDSVKGFGIRSKKQLCVGEFVCFYSGKFTTKTKDGRDHYVFEIKGEKNVLIDATKNDGSFGRLVNDDHRNPNLKVKAVECNGKKYPCFFARLPISIGEPLEYNYGGDSTSYWWRDQRKKQEKESNLCKKNTQENYDPDLSKKDQRKKQEKESNLSKKNTQENYDPDFSKRVMSLEKIVQKLERNQKEGNSRNDKNFETIMQSVNRNLMILNQNQMLFSKLLGLPLDESNSVKNSKGYSSCQVTRYNALSEKAESSNFNKNPAITHTIETYEKEEIQNSVSVPSKNYSIHEVITDETSNEEIEYSDLLTVDLPNTPSENENNEKEETSYSVSVPSKSYSACQVTRYNALSEKAESSNFNKNPAITHTIETYEKEEIQNSVSVPSKNYSIHEVITDETSNEEIEYSDLLTVDLPNTPSENENNEKEETSYSVSVPSKRKVKPLRPCYYCKKYFTQITRHISRRHKDEKEVDYALSLPRQQGLKQLDKLRKMGMFYANTQKLSTEKNPELLRERRDNIKSGYVVCGGCFGTYGKRYIASHKKHCDFYSGTIKYQRSINISNEKDEEAFKDEILDTFRKRNEEATKMCLNDPLVLKVGKDLFTNVYFHPNKKEICKKRIRSSMKYLARLFIEFANEGKKKNLKLKAEDIINVHHFPTFLKALQRVSSNKYNDCDADEDSTSSSNIKGVNSTILHLRVAVNQLVSTLRYTYAIEKNEKMQNEIKKFHDLYNSRGKFIFGEAVFNVKNRRKTTLRRPVNLPLEDDVKKLKEFICSELNHLNQIKNWKKDDFIKARRLSVCFLTFFNVRRSGEPCRITIKEIDEAIEKSWISSRESADIKNNADKSMLLNNLILYEDGKGDQVVPVQIPNFIIPTILKLKDKENRETAAVDPSNSFIFPSTKRSNSYASGWHDATDTCKMAGVSKNLTADKMRHRASTFLSRLPIAEREKELYFQHIGHSKNIDLEVYASPPSEAYLINVGKHLYNFFYLDKPVTSESDKETECIRLSRNEENEKLDKSLSSESDKESACTSFATNQTQDKSLSSESDKESACTSFATNQTQENCNTRKRKGAPLISTCSSIKKGKKYHRWSSEETVLVRSFFLETIENDKWKLPDKSTLETFLLEHTSILFSENPRERQRILKNKIYNEFIKQKTIIKKLFSSN